jgi:putative ABC transport system substrate-binding protein
MTRFIIAIITCILLSMASIASAKDVLVVRNYKAKPYDEALQGFRKTCNARISELVIPELDGEDVATEVRRRRPDLIFAMGIEALRQVRQIKEKPIVYAMVLHPESVLNGEKNITGISMVIPPEKQLADFRKILPGLKRIGLIYESNNMGKLVARTRRAAERSGLELEALKAQHPGDFPVLLNGMKGKIDAYWMLPDSMTVTPQNMEYLILFSMQNSIPVFGFSEKYLDLGAFLSVEIDPFRIGKQAGRMAGKILDGVPAEDIPATDAADAVLKINYNVAKKMGLAVSGEALNNIKRSR